MKLGNVCEPYLRRHASAQQRKCSLSSDDAVPCIVNDSITPEIPEEEFGYSHAARSVLRGLSLGVALEEV